MKFYQYYNSLNVAKVVYLSCFRREEDFQLKIQTHRLDVNVSEKNEGWIIIKILLNEHRFFLFKYDNYSEWNINVT